jgi:hypothetical protein
MLIFIIGWPSEYPFWARILGSIPSTLNVFLDVEGDTLGVLSLEFGDVGKRYLRFFCRKTGYTRQAHKTRHKTYLSIFGEKPI